MFCTNCGKVIEPDIKFCPHCGTFQTPESSVSPSPMPAATPAPATPPRFEPSFGTAPAMAMPTTAAPARAGGSQAVLWAGVGTLVLALAGGVGYWGWSNKVASEEAVRKLASDEQARKAVDTESARKIADEEQRRLVAQRAAESAQINAAQAALDRHIAAEEAQAQTSGSGTQTKR